MLGKARVGHEVEKLLVSNILQIEDEHIGRLEFERDCLRLLGGSTVRYDDQPSLPASGDREFRYLVTDEVGCRDLTQFFGVIAPGRAPDHSHVYDEVIYVLEGEGTLHIDGEHEPVASGTCIHLPPLREHSLENSGDGPMKVVAVFHPAGDPASRAYEANE